MPTQTIHQALLEIFFAIDGAPWIYPRWQQLTDVHNGLFPDDPELSPKGLPLEQKPFVESYFSQYANLRKAEEKQKFASAIKNASSVPGRKFWRDFVTLVVRDSALHRVITQVLTDLSLHPAILVANRKNRSFESWPDSRGYLPLAVDGIGEALFGPEAFDSLGRLEWELREPVLAIAQRTWNNVKNTLSRGSKRTDKYKEDATNAFNG